MRKREPRRNVLIRARLRDGPSWADISIRNISSRGLMVQTGSAPRRGSYVEVRRGRHVIVARVAWSSGTKCGLQAQDRIDIDAMIAEPDQSAIDFKKASAADPGFERRSAPRTRTRTPTLQEVGRRAERSRFHARAMQFAGVGAVVLMLAVGVFSAVSSVLPAPMDAVSAALEPKPGRPG